jgi:hypothetical protein
MKRGEIKKEHTRKSSISDNIPGSNNSLSSKMLPPSNKINNSFATLKTNPSGNIQINKKVSNPSINTKLNPDKSNSAINTEFKAEKALFAKIRKIAKEKEEAFKVFGQTISKINVDTVFQETNSTTKAGKIKNLYSNLENDLIKVIAPSLAQDEKDLLDSLVHSSHINTSHIALQFADKLNISINDKSTGKILDKSNISHSEYKGNTSINNASILNNTQYYKELETWSIKDYAKKVYDVLCNQEGVIEYMKKHLHFKESAILKNIHPFIIFKSILEIDDLHNLFDDALSFTATKVNKPAKSMKDFINEYTTTIEQEKFLKLNEQYNDLVEEANITNQGNEQFLKGSGEYGEEKDIGWINPHFGKYTIDAIEHILGLRIRDLGDLQLQDVKILQGRFISQEHNNLSNLLAQISSSMTQTTIVPLNLFDKHATGLVFTKTLTNEFQVTYFDSLNEPVPQELEQLISDYFDSKAKINFKQITVEQQKYANCGSEVIENFIYYFTGQRCTQEEAIALHNELGAKALLGKDSIGTFLSFGTSSSPFEEHGSLQEVGYDLYDQLSTYLPYSDLEYSDLLGVTTNNE